MQQMQSMLLSPVFYQNVLLLAVFVLAAGRAMSMEPLRQPTGVFAVILVVPLVMRALPFWYFGDVSDRLLIPWKEQFAFPALSGGNTGWWDVVLHVLLMGAMGQGQLLAALMAVNMTARRQAGMLELPDSEALPEGRRPLILAVIAVKTALSFAGYFAVVVCGYRLTAVHLPGIPLLACRLAASVPGALCLALLGRHLRQHETPFRAWMLLHGLVGSAGLYITGDLYFPLLFGVSLLPACVLRLAFGPQWACEERPAWWHVCRTGPAMAGDGQWLALPDIPDAEIPEVAGLVQTATFPLNRGLSLWQRDDKITIEDDKGVRRVVEGIDGRILTARAGTAGVTCVTDQGVLWTILWDEKKKLIREVMLDAASEPCSSAALGRGFDELVLIRGGVVHCFSGHILLFPRPVAVPVGVVMEQVAAFPRTDMFLLRDRQGAVWYLRRRATKICPTGLTGAVASLPGEPLRSAGQAFSE